MNKRVKYIVIVRTEYKSKTKLNADDLLLVRITMMS